MVNYCEDSHFAFLCGHCSSTHSLSIYISLSYFMSENRSEIRETLNFIDFLRVVGICAVVYEDMLERERERQQNRNSNNNKKDTNFLPSFGDMEKRERTGRLTVKHCSLRTFSRGALPADWFCDDGPVVLDVSLAISWCICCCCWCWSCRCFWSKAWWSEEDAFLVLIGDSGSNWASPKSALLERVFTADPESVLSPPDFELPCNEQPTKKYSHDQYPQNHPKIILVTHFANGYPRIIPNNIKSPQNKKSFELFKWGFETCSKKV